MPSAAATGLSFRSEVLAVEHFGWRHIASDLRLLIHKLAKVGPDMSLLGRRNGRVALVIALAAMLTTASVGGQTTAGNEPAYIGSSACASCHQPEYSAWSNSHHSWAWRQPNADNVLAEFGAPHFFHNEVTTRFKRRDGRYFIKTD